LISLHIHILIVIQWGSSSFESEPTNFTQERDKTIYVINQEVPKEEVNNLDGRNQ